MPTEVPPSAPQEFAGKTCAVTGTGQGLGLTVARILLERGAIVIGLTRTKSQALDDELAAFRGRGSFIKCDVSQPGDVASAFETIRKDYGDLDVLVNNAGTSHQGEIARISPDDWHQVMAVNVTGAFLCLQAAAPLLAGRRGAIVNVSSIAGRSRSRTMSCAYTTSKAALIGLTRHAATELGRAGIRVNCICPSQHYTPMLRRALSQNQERDLIAAIPLGYIADPVQVAEVIVFLASDRSSYMTGSIVDVNGGLL